MGERVTARLESLGREKVSKIMGMYESAKNLARAGFYVFPLEPGAKIPHIKNFTEEATRDPAKIKKWWVLPDGTEFLWNVGIITSKYDYMGEQKALIVVDIDTKKDGPANLAELDKDACPFPVTVTQLTPTGGEHKIYFADAPVKQGVDILAKGVDIRSRGGLIVGAGSVINGRAYSIFYKPIVQCPAWIITKCESTDSPPVIADLNVPVDFYVAYERAIYYLVNTAPSAISGSGGQSTALSVIGKLGDYGVSNPDDSLDLLLDHWNSRCSPPWTGDELKTLVENSYHYRKNSIGAAAPEADFEAIDDYELPVFEPTETPVEKDKSGEVLEADKIISGMNKRFAFITFGKRHQILEEVVNKDKTIRAHFFMEPTFHAKYSNTPKIPVSKNRWVDQTAAWIKNPHRVDYSGLMFEPSIKGHTDKYNLWSGFKLLPCKNEKDISPKGIPAVERFKYHIKNNICVNDEKLYGWLISWFADIFKNPGKKSLVALVFHGGKGTGKSITANIVGHLCGEYYQHLTDPRYLVGNFNSHMENCLLATFDEAIFSGSALQDSKLKSVITEPTIQIERKGLEAFQVKNNARVIIIGNDRWLIRASEDERRYAVFDVGEGNKQDLSFFSGMQDGILNHGGDRLLMKFFMDWDPTGHDINQAPNTIGLANQKEQTMDIVYEWLRDCLIQGEIEEGQDWPEDGFISERSFKEACFKFIKDHRRMYAKNHTHSELYELARKAILLKKHQTRNDGGTRTRGYELPLLIEARKQYEEFSGKPLEISD